MNGSNKFPVTVWTAPQAASEGIGGDRQTRANSIAPGAIRTELGGGLNNEFEALLASLTALGRVGEPDDVGCVVASLLSDDNRWINGQERRRNIVICV